MEITCGVFVVEKMGFAYVFGLKVDLQYTLHFLRY